MKSWTRFLAAMIVVSAASLAARAQTPPASVAQVVRDLAALRAELAAGSQFDFVRSKREGTAPSEVSARLQVMCLPGYNLRRSIPGADASTATSAAGYNPDYGFSVSRKPPRPTWNITDLRLGVGHEAAAVRIRDGQEGVTLEQAALLAVPFLNVVDLPIERLLESPTFHLMAAAIDGNRLRVEFTADIESVLGPSRVTGGTLWFLPGSRHALDEYRVKVVERDNTQIMAAMKVTWLETGARPIPAADRAEYADVKPKPVTITRTFSNWSYAAPPDTAAFRLPYYGLPEPALDPPPSSRVWYYVAAAVAGVLLIGVGLRLRHRHPR